MNIFVSNPDTYESANALDDKRVIKMILESAQLMATAINLSGGEAPYKTTHKNHPCSIWVRENQANYWWLFQHWQALCQVYYDRFGKSHKTLDYILQWRDGVYLLPKGELTPFPNCTTFKEESDTFLAYRKYLSSKWIADKRVPKWTNAVPPVWREA